MRRSAALAGAGALVAVAVALAVAMTSSRRHAIASNYIRPITFIAHVPAWERVCQRDQDVPAGTGAIELRIGTFGRPGPRLDLTVRDGRETIARGTRAAGWHEGDVAIDVPEIASRREVAEVCVRNASPRTIAVAGGSTNGVGASVDGEPAAGAVRLTYLEPETRSWFAFAPTVSRRIAWLRDAPPGGGTLPLFGVLMLLVAAGALTVVVRAGRG